MTREQFNHATKTLQAKGYESVGSVICTTPEMCGVHYINHENGEKFLLNKFTFNDLPA